MPKELKGNRGKEGQHVPNAQSKASSVSVDQQLVFLSVFYESSYMDITATY